MSFVFYIIFQTYILYTLKTSTNIFFLFLKIYSNFYSSIPMHLFNRVYRHSIYKSAFSFLKLEVLPYMMQVNNLVKIPHKYKKKF